MSVPLSQNVTLQALVDRVIPANEFPSGWQTGLGDFFEAVLATERPESSVIVTSGLDLLQREARGRHDGMDFAALPTPSQDALIDDLLHGKTSQAWKDIEASEFLMLVIRLAAQGFYGRSGATGSRGASSWEMVGYDLLPAGATWPAVATRDLLWAEWDAITDEYDVVVIGAGAGGGVAACVLAEAGCRVLLVEQGTWLSPGSGWPDHLRNQSAFLGYPTRTLPAPAGNPRIVDSPTGDVILPPTDPRWQSIATTVGGGTRVYGAQAWRFCPVDFRMASTYGVPEGSSLADWPISYDELEPFYDRAEWEIGVAGTPIGHPVEGFRSRGYPMPPLPGNAGGTALDRGARNLGLTTGPVPLLVNSAPRDGRGACVGCAACIGFACPGDFKNGTHNTVILRALATGQCALLTASSAVELSTDTRGVVTGVVLATDIHGSVHSRTVRCSRVVVAAGAIETARLLLNSHSAREPRGIGNNHDQVGRNLQGHVYAGAVGIFGDCVQDCRGPGPSIATHDYRHHNDGLIGGAMLANDFVPTPIHSWGTLTAVGAIPLWGEGSKRGMRELYSRAALVTGPVQEIPNPDSRVTVDAGVRDKFGMPAAKLSGSIRPEDRTMANFVSERTVEWLEASGAEKVFRFNRVMPDGPSGSQHQAGTCRMGADPRSSVTDSRGCVWGHENLYIADGSLHVTNGGVNPVLTIFANAYRVAGCVARA